jgi:hypothetical protein
MQEAYHFRLEIRLAPLDTPEQPVFCKPKRRPEDALQSHCLGTKAGSDSPTQRKGFAAA